MGNRSLFIFITLYFWIGAIWQGYFAETAYLSSNLFLFAGLLVMLCLKRELVFTRVHFFVVLFVVAYWVTLFYSVDVERSVLEAARVSGLIPLSFLIKMLPDDQIKRLYRSWPWIGALMTIMGIVLEMERNGRLESTLEYANALAIFLLVNIGVSLLLFLEERRIAHLALMSVNAVGLLLTFSRSVWVLWLVLLLAAAIWFPEIRKRRMWLSIGVAHICSAAMALLIKGDAFFFWQRVSSIESKTSEFQIRLVYWKDSLGMIRDFWWGGTGGGGWSVILHQYRSQDYFVRFVHNHYVQVALDVGVFGLLLFVIWLGIFYWAGMKRIRLPAKEDVPWIKGILLFVSVMVLHAGFDFDLSFPFLFGVLVCLTIPMDTKNWKLRVSKRVIAMSLPFSIALVVMWGWLAVGYGYNQAADFHVRAGQYEKAQELYARAERLLPWSSWVLYGSAKGYVSRGNESGDASFYQLATEKLNTAHERVPEQTLYSDLLDQLQENSTKNN